MAGSMRVSRGFIPLTRYCQKGKNVHGQKPMVHSHHLPGYQAINWWSASPNPQEDTSGPRFTTQENQMAGNAAVEGVLRV